MSNARAPSHGAAALLLEALADPLSVRALTEDAWDVLVRVARASELLGTLDARIGVPPWAGATPARAWCDEF